ncbi:MAG TPA: IS630 family transposase [Gammaproteobacteria bacterium]|nr:IS630 family transposase [Gammaproteobacteria bacterium]
MVGSCCCYPRGCLSPRWRFRSISLAAISINGSIASKATGWPAWRTNPDPADRRFFPPEVGLHVVKLACERPEQSNRSLCHWFCVDLAAQLIADGIVPYICAETVRRILMHHQLKPWRYHLWLTPKKERDAAFYDTVSALAQLYTRDLSPEEIVLCIDEKTSLQPRPRLAPTRPAQPGNVPNHVDHHYRRDGALNLFAAFDTRTGQVYGQCHDRKRQVEFIAFLDYLEQTIDPAIETIHIVCDNIPTHHGKKVQQWRKKHSRFQFHFTPTYCSWMNQIEQWFSILQRKRLRFADFVSKADLQTKIEQFIAEWNLQAHPFNWSSKSVAKVMAKATKKPTGIKKAA